MDPRDAVLIIEDDLELRTLLGSLLESERYRVFQAEDAEQGLKALTDHSGSIRLVITDLNLPRLSGVELIGKIRTLDGTMKILGTSGLSTPQVREMVIRAGANGFVAKPYTFLDLLKEVRSLMEKP